MGYKFIPMVIFILLVKSDYFVLYKYAYEPEDLYGGREGAVLTADGTARKTQMTVKHPGGFLEYSIPLTTEMEKVIQVLAATEAEADTHFLQRQRRPQRRWLTATDRTGSQASRDSTAD